MNDLPGFDLTIEADARKISGVVAFCFQLRGDDSKWSVKDKYTVCMLTPKAEGKALVFEVIDYKTQYSAWSECQVMELTGENEALLHKVDDQPAPPLKLTRRR